MTAVQTYRGGRVARPDPDQPERPKERRRYPCFADGCPMPGSIFPGAGVGGTGDAAGSCAWHYGANPTDIPRITSVIRQWESVSREIGEARRALTDEKTATNPRALADRFVEAVRRLQDAANGSRFAPELLRHNDRGGTPETYGAWAVRLSKFLTARLAEAMNTTTRRAA